jgi:sugar-specific transcriptional regulator TrmB
MNKYKHIFEKLSFTPNEVAVYTALLLSGSSSIRKIAEKAGLNRGVTYNALKALEKRGLISYYHKEKKQHFSAEDPGVLKNIIEQQKMTLEETSKELTSLITELKTQTTPTDRPVVKFYDNQAGIRNILEDVLESVSNLPKKEYVAFSSSTIRPYLYDKEVFPTFNNERIKKRIFVRTIANGEGGTTYGKDERKWLSKEDSAPTYKLIYAGKVAMISVGKNDTLHGIIIEDQNLFETELAIFNALWRKI